MSDQQEEQIEPLHNIEMRSQEVTYGLPTAGPTAQGVLVLQLLYQR